jgi:hypothetical protein
MKLMFMVTMTTTTTTTTTMKAKKTFGRSRRTWGSNMRQM